MMANKLLVKCLKKMEVLSAVSCRLTQITGKSRTPIHPKHLLIKDIPEYFKFLRKTDIVLDLGCHRAKRTLKISKHVKKIIGVDIDKNLFGDALKEIKINKIKNLKLQCLNAEDKLPFEDGYFDKVIFLDVLEHLNNRDTALKEIRRILKKNGMLVASVPNKNTNWKMIQQKAGIFYFSDPDHKIEFSKKSFINILNKNGFKIEKFSAISYDDWFLPIIDLIGGLSLTIYKRLSVWKRNLSLKYPENSSGFMVIAKPS